MSPLLTRSLAGEARCTAWLERQASEAAEAVFAYQATRRVDVGERTAAELEATCSLRQANQRVAGWRWALQEPTHSWAHYGY